MDTEMIIKGVSSYAKDILGNRIGGHDYWHTARVYQVALVLAEDYEEADRFIVSLAALLHDVDDQSVSPVTSGTKSNARSAMRSMKISKGTAEQVVRIIDEISYKGKDSIAPSTIEGKCVQDADRLDSIGAIGIARCFMYTGANDLPMWDPYIEPKLDMSADEYRNSDSSAINHFYEKLFKLKDTMNTDKARRIAEDRTYFMKEYMKRFKAEWYPELTR